MRLLSAVVSQGFGTSTHPLGDSGSPPHSGSTHSMSVDESAEISPDAIEEREGHPDSVEDVQVDQTTNEEEGHETEVIDDVDNINRHVLTDEQSHSPNERALQDGSLVARMLLLKSIREPHELPTALSLWPLNDESKKTIMKDQNNVCPKTVYVPIL